MLTRRSSYLQHNTLSLPIATTGRQWMVGGLEKEELWGKGKWRRKGKGGIGIRRRKEGGEREGEREGKERILNPKAGVLLCAECWMEVCLQIGSLSSPRVCMWVSLSMGNILIIIIIIIIGKRRRGRGGVRKEKILHKEMNTFNIHNTQHSQPIHKCEFFFFSFFVFFAVFFVLSLFYVVCCFMLVCIYILYTLCMYINIKKKRCVFLSIFPQLLRFGFACLYINSNPQNLILISFTFSFFSHYNLKKVASNHTQLFPQV